MAAVNYAYMSLVSLPWHPSFNACLKKKTNIAHKLNVHRTEHIFQQMRGWEFLLVYIVCKNVINIFFAVSPFGNFFAEIWRSSLRGPLRGQFSCLDRVKMKNFKSGLSKFLNQLNVLINGSHSQVLSQTEKAIIF